MTKISNSEELERNHLLFPLESLSVFPKTFIYELNSKNNFNIDYCASIYLFCLSSLIGNKIKLKVKNGWEVTASLNIALLGNPGTNKSGPLDQLTKPLQNYHIKNYKDYLSKYAVFLKEIKNSNNEQFLETNEPKLKQLIVQDVTAEALNQILFDNPIGVGAIFDELNALVSNANRYNGGNILTNLLSIYDGKNIMVNRKIKHQIPLYIEHPFLSIIGGIQPKIALKAFGDKSMVDSGFTSRFIMIYPEIKKMSLSKEEIDTNLFERYNSLFAPLIDLREQEDKITLCFSLEAFETFLAYNKDLTREINSTPNPTIKGMLTKLDTIVVKICLILHIDSYLANPTNNLNKEINIKTVWDAIGIAEYFKKSNLKFYDDLLFHDDPLSSYPLIYKVFYESLPLAFTAQQALQILNGRFTERTMFRFFKDQELFQKNAHNQYQKII